MFDNAMSERTDDPKEEIRRYLAYKDTDVAMLHRYPLVKNSFLNLTCRTCSSAPVECLFSFANLILRPNRLSMTDASFEKLLLLPRYKYLCLCKYF